ncbi:hypothetical protein A2276_05955 [candidate division WOR-1 bacterium RIFOXYA12_FULL_43_27]|uniref:Glycosyltransferase 2-like domain-containing protein n=1 Tax=candidate division WOR-1 bacterium RIFOXYC2_FULL_46_14 TaxID=1802587 RepID=A0A1F4U3K3_UNCSA|nr:MAG: hypothetical protein A2276_05955 [candidate division WOR-1 bacterium RIFOXYA12_FULL_43_27]OGC20205.1 MAG: hypothetical protein A2292_03955 [candidate division WOR-1 bacterium RIFOXYB2_FULL_46_45]OGC32057.1 MAG: hypothetical protein A2232_07490 [candidate division WOR-1 bacterium RIFOXYA2_FULL_46_56]OGC39459.1 MAG: hypothetical protein A2438_07855 [candidate division WOR-1 bacterium RIFOXYC2_FULL_46_14]
MIPKVSVVIATHNHAHFLPECLASVKAQTYQNYEVIVVNNGSIDNTEEVVRNLAWDKLRYHYQSDTGSVAGPRNTGIKLAEGDYVAFLDSDDIWHEDKLEKVMRVFMEKPEIDILSHDVSIFEKGKSDLNIVDRVGPLSENMFRQLLTVGNCLNGSATVVAKRVFAKIGGFDESKDFVHAEDYEAWLRIAYHGYNFYFINETLGKWRMHESNLSNDFGLVCKNWINVLNKYYKKFNVRNPIDRIILRNKSLSGVHFITAAKHHSQKKYIQFLVSLAKSFLLSPVHFFKMIYARRIEKRSGIIGNCVQK